MMVLRAGVGCQTAFTASQISTAKSSSVPVKLSGLYWNIQFGIRLACRVLGDERRAAHGDVDDAGPIETEDDTALYGRSRVV